MNMTVDQWESEFSPIQNVCNDFASWDGRMFETYGEDLNWVSTWARKYPQRVWTLVDDGEELSIINGFHYVNRVGYFVTDRGWETGATINVQVIVWAHYYPTDGDVFV